MPGGRESITGAKSDGFEGFARTFLAAAFRLAGARGAAPGDLAERYADGLAAGTAGKGDEAWPHPRSYSQPLVEAASIAIALYECRPWIWDHLPDAVRTRVVDWLASVHGKEYWPNNWLLFQVMVNAFLKSVGAPFRQSEIDDNLDRIDSMYRRDGWYTDGEGNNFDHYVGWALHLYTILWCRMDGDHSDPARAAVYRERIRSFLEDDRHLFGSDGAPLYQGRSLIYRFAATAPLWAGVLADASPLSPGETRRIASGCLRYFIEHGCLRDGVLTMGWYGEFLPMAQIYSGPASPYWASKAFLGLLLPPEHEVWTAPEEPMAVERASFCRAMSVPGFLAVGTREDGIVRVANHRSDHFPFFGVPNEPHYCKLAYSTRTAPEIAADGNALDVDSHVALLDSDGSPTHRQQFHTIAVADHFAASIHYPDEPAGPGEQSPATPPERIETVSIGHAGAEIRVHHVTTSSNRRVRDGGFALADGAPPAIESGGDWSLVRRRDGTLSFIAALHGFEATAARQTEGSNAFGRHSAVPFATSAPQTAAEGVYVSLVALSNARVDATSLRELVDSVEVEGRRVLIRCRDGAQFLVQLVAADTVDRRFGSHRLSGPVRYARLASNGELFVVGESSRRP